VIDDLLQAAMLEEDVLSGAQFVSRLTELVGHTQHGSPFSAILDAGVTVPRHAQVEIQRPIASHGEAEVRGHHYVALSGRHRHFNRAAVESQHQWGRRAAFSCGHMQSAGRAHTHTAASAQGNLCCVFSCGHRCIADKDRASIGHLKRARYRGILYADRADRLLRMRCSAHYSDPNHQPTHHHLFTYIFRKF
jgi:hypothetical protein